MLVPRTISVYGDSELGHAVRHGLKTWGHTVHVLANPDDVDSLIETLWIAIDTPVTTQGEPSLTWLQTTIDSACARLEPDAMLIISSQVPVGFVTQLQQRRPDIDVVSIPEYFRRGHVSEGFQNPGFIVIGVNDTIDRERILSLYPERLCNRILWMSAESAEMSKHALNCLLGMSIIFSNEIARLSQQTHAEYGDVERVLRCDPRVGKSAYVASGPADGSHFLRDMRYLQDIDTDQSGFLPFLIGRWPHLESEAVLGS